MQRSLFTGLLAAALTAASLPAQQTAAFVIRLGQDTTSVERFTRGKDGWEVDQVGRVPRVLRRHAVVTLGPDGALRTADITVTRVGGAAGGPPAQHILAARAGDSITIEAHVDTNVRRNANAVPAGAATPIISGWVTYDGLAMRLFAGKGDSVRVPMYYLNSPDLSWVAVRRLGKDSVDIETQFDRYHARVDKKGQILGLRPIKGTQQYSVERVASVDLEAFVSAFAAKEAQGGAVGALSPRDTARATVGAANLWIDYGRPTRRGRVIFGGVVPWGDVWRTGANAATQFSTDKALRFGSAAVPAGKYTLWTVPTPTGWTLIINSETGQWGTEHHADKDLFKIPLSVTSSSPPVEKFTIHIAPGDNAGQIHFVWDTLVAQADFTVAE
ncbi:MAG TPA: DUF2911 domain-containing protein [Gemmatimonadales bacterium]|nr:DUF2911 domain-containing protein [Gemmatimonadales bacterium]